MKLKLLSLIALSAISLQANANSAMAIPHNASGHVGDKIRIEAQHIFDITNDTDRMQSYIVMERITVNGKEYKKGWGFNLGMRHKRHFDETIGFAYYPDQVGEFKIEAETSVAGYPSVVNKGYATLKVD